jgi:hypothetical protein
MKVKIAIIVGSLLFAGRKAARTRAHRNEAA